MKTILFPTDFSSNALHASKYAGMLARQLNAKVVLLHSYDVPVFLGPTFTDGTENLIQQLARAAETNLAQFANNFIEEAGLPPAHVTHVTGFGFLSDVIAETAQSTHADMIVMGTKGASNALDRWIGTNAQKVMRTAGCPVWIIPKNAPLHFPATIMYAADFEEDEILATQKVLAIATPLGATCKVVHVHEYFELNIMGQYQQTASDLKEEFEEEDVTFTTLNHTGIVEALEIYIKNHKPDVLALAVHEKSFLSRVFDSSITEHFVQEGKLPMLTFIK